MKFDKNIPVIGMKFSKNVPIIGMLHNSSLILGHRTGCKAPTTLFPNKGK